MSDLHIQARAMRDALEAKKAEASQAWAALDSMKKSAIAEGVDFSKNAEAFDKLDAAGKSYDSLRDEASELQAKYSRLMELAGEAAPAAEAKAADRKGASMGEVFVKSAAYKFAADRAGSPAAIGATEGVKVADRAEIKTLLSVGTGLANVPVEDRTNIIVAKPLAGLDLLNLIATSTTNSDLVEWIEESTYTNAAAETAEGSASPESALAFTVKTAAVKDVTHWLPTTRRALADVAWVEGWINNRLIDGVRRRLQTQILTGNGSGENFTGIYNTSGIGSVDMSDTGLTMLEAIHRAITTVRTNAFQEPDFVGINPADYETLRLVKASTAGTYQFGDPSVGGPITVWGVPVISHAAFTAGSPLVGVAREATLFVREGVNVAVSDSHSDYFTKKQVALMASMRAAFGVTQPAAFCKVVA